MSSDHGTPDEERQHTAGSGEFARARRETGDRLRASEAHLRVAIEAARMGTWEWDADTGLVTADAAHQALFGLPPTDEPQPVERYWARMVPGEIAAAMARAQAALEHGTTFEMEHRVIRPDGRVVWMFARGHAMDDGRRRMIGVSFDITERKRTDEALRRSEARLQAAVDLRGLGLYAWDPQTNALEWDARVKAMWGLPPDAPVDYDIWLAGVHPGDRARVLAALEACLDPSRDGVNEIEYRVTGIYDGVERWISTRGRTTFENGKATTFFGVAVDVSKRRQTVEILRESEERFRQFGEYSSNALWILDLKTRGLVYLSAAYESIWGRPRLSPVLPEADWLEAIHPDDREQASAALEQAVAGEAMMREYRVVRPDGAVRWIRDTLFPIRDPAGRVERVGGIAQDISATSGSTVYVVDADPGARQALCLLLHEAGYNAKAFAAGPEFLQLATVLAPGCVVIEIRSSLAQGLATLRQLRAARGVMPVIVTGVSNGDVRVVVQVMRAGAVDWLEMPYEPEALLAAVAGAMANIQEAGEQNRDAEFARARIATMSIRERQVLEGLLAGGTNKVIARDLGISPRTVELYRASVMERLGARTLSEAVLLAAAAGFGRKQPALPP